MVDAFAQPVGANHDAVNIFQYIAAITNGGAFTRIRGPLFIVGEFGVDVAGQQRTQQAFHRQRSIYNGIAGVFAVGVEQVAGEATVGAVAQAKGGQIIDVFDTDGEGCLTTVRPRRQRQSKIDTKVGD